MDFESVSFKLENPLIIIGFKSHKKSPKTEAFGLF